MDRPRICFVSALFLVVLFLLLYPIPVSYAQSPDTSQLVTLTCTGSPCNWGTSLSGQALVWPASLGPLTNRLGYTASAGIYLPASAASGMTVSITSGTVTMYAGLPDAASHRVLATLSSGQSHLITGLAAGEVVSVQSGNVFTYSLTIPPPATATPTATSPTATPTPACTDPTTCNPVSSIHSFWRCNIPGCTHSDWIGSVISWPSWSAYEDNARTGSQSRTVFSAEGEKLYPYMGSWAEGCQVTAVSGTALIIEWQRGTDVWQEIWLEPGQSHTIALTSPEDGALIEGPPAPGFSVSLANCNPQSIQKTPTPTPTSTNTPTDTPTPAPTVPGALTIGETNILGTDDSGNGDLLVAQQVVLPQSATLQSLSFYVTSASGQLRLGLYDDAGGNPGTLRAQTAAFTPVAGWNTQNVVTPVLLPAGTYWLAYLAQSNNLHFRVELTGSARGYGYSFGPMPTTFSSSPLSGTLHWSLYATLLTGTALTPTPTNTPTATPIPPTATPTNTPEPTATPTDTLIPTSTPTDTPMPPTATPTNTPEPTATPTDTPIPTNTPMPPTATPTNTPEPTATPTDTPIPTNTPTDTPMPPTATPTNTPLPTNTPAPTPTVSGVFSIGETNILGTDDSGYGNRLIAQQVVLSQSASIQSMSVYISSAAGQLRLGIYDDVGGNPGILRAQTAIFTPTVGWNTQNVLTPTQLSPGTYWLVYLAQSNSLRFRMTLSGAARGYNYSFGAMPGAFPSPPFTGTLHWSLYATLLNSTASLNTPLPPASTPTDTPMATNTPEPPTATPTNTPEPPTPVPTNTPEPPAATPTDTPEPPSATPTNTLEPPTPVPTNTPEPPTATPTDTPEPPTATPTNTPEPPTPIPTNTQ